MTDCLHQQTSIVYLGGRMQMVKRNDGTWYLVYTGAKSYEQGNDIKYCPLCGRKLT